MIQPNANSPQFGHSHESSATSPALPVLASDSPANCDYHIRQGHHYYKQYSIKPNLNDLNAAMVHFQKAVDLDSNRIEGLVGLISALWECGPEHLDKLRYYAEKALNLDTHCHQAHYYLGLFFQQVGYTQKALEHLTNALKKGPFINPKARFALAQLMFTQQAKQPTWLKKCHWGIEAALQNTLGILTVPMDPVTLKSVTTAAISDIGVYCVHWTASALKQLGHPNHAVKLYEIGHQWLPQETIFNHLLGDQYFFDLKSPQLAIDYYEKALRDEPDNSDLLKKLGKAYAQISDNESAIEQFTRVLDIDPVDFDAHYNLGQLAIEQKTFIRALYFFKEAANIKPRHPFVHSNMGYVLFKMEDMEGALQEYKTALDLGSDAIWLSSVAQTIATIAYKIFGDTEGALDHLQQSLHYNPDNRDALATMGDIYFENDYIEMALAAYQALVRLEPDNSDCFSNIGYILWQLDRNDEAIEAYQKALKHNKNNAIAHNNLGVIYIDEKGNAPQALLHFKLALDIKPDYTLAAFNKGRASEAMEQTLDAAEFYSHALALNDLNPELEHEEIQERLDNLFQ